MNSALALGLAEALHILSAVVWIGGMFFTLVVLRPALLKLQPALEPATRLALFSAVLRRFFIVVWHAVVILLFTGYWLLLQGFGGFATAPVYVHLMHVGGLVMALIFLVLFFRHFRPMRAAVAAGDKQLAAGRLESIRRLVVINLLLGLCVVVIASAGRYF